MTPRSNWFWTLASRRRIVERRGGLAVKLHTLLVFLFLYAPIVILIVFSFNNSRINAVWRGFTLEWYGKLLQNAAIMSAFWNTMVVALISTVAATTIGTVTAYGLTRFHVRFRGLYDSLIYMPIIMPEIIMGISLLVFLVLIGMQLGLSTIIIGHVVFNISFVTVVVSARLAGADPALEEAAMDLGANQLQTFLRVILPIIKPGIIAGALLAFTLSFDDFVITFFVAGVGATTLPLKIFSMIKFGVTPEINAISAILILVSTLIVLASQGIGRKNE
jgi:spermidine/putrescine transport system permease protein